MLPVGDGAPIDPGSRALVAATWAFRCRAERESELRFARLARELSALGAAPLVAGMARRASHDEHRHAQLCAALCARYGGAVPTHPAHDHPARVAGLGARDGLLYELVAFCCVAETINAQLLTAILRRASAPRIVRAVRRLLRDEVDHARLGWAQLAAERRDGRGDFLAPLLPALLAGSVEPALFDEGPEPVGEAAIAHGELPRLDRVALFSDALRETVLPGFASFGLEIAPALAWLDGRCGARS
ncbi:MAG: ferritin-like domain-containing protein [Deltaproteobacteria bacterium]